ncbi:type II secretion system protein [Psychrobacillus psychrotolerans]|uniref:type II secretion system protein n=1 Tax=Psychrobacillus psychrotolerans TaxID=126156 RepID=UPI003B011C39
MKKFTKILKNQKGLTLIELLAVIVILAIVAAIAVPSIGSIINNSRDKAILSDASAIMSGAKIAMTDGSCKTKTDTDGNTCTAEELKDYVEGIKLATSDQIVKTATGYSITYSKLSNIQNETKFNNGGFKKGDTTITDTELISAMNQ